MAGTSHAMPLVMPADFQRPDAPIPTWFAGDPAHLPDDAEFDRAFPERVRASSEIHWTSVEVCRHAARWLVTGPDTRVLDIGCGPGKFCAIGAATTRGHFTGVEQRKHLCRTARTMLRRYGISRVQILHANVMDVPFSGFDAFYLFNPFEENLTPGIRIDDEVPVELDYYHRYINYTRRQLSQLPLGTRVVTFWGDCDEIPPGYDCEEKAYGGQLRLWIKRRADAPGEIEIAREAFDLPDDLEFSVA